MTFPINTTIPAAGNNPSNDQQPMQTNFANINSYLGIDHTTPGTNPGDGQHKQVTFHLNQAAPSFANGVSGLYANLVSSASQLFFQNSNGSVQLTGLTVSSSGNDFGISTPWGVKMNWGQVSTSALGTPVNFQVAYSSLSSISVQLTSQSSTLSLTSVSAINVTTTSFKAVGVLGVPTFYFAIGV